MAKILHPDGTHEIVHPKEGKRFSLTELQGYVGGLIELVPQKEDYDVVVNEEGLCQNLKYNEQGSALAAGHHLVGDVIILEGEERLQ